MPLALFPFTCGSQRNGVLTNPIKTVGFGGLGRWPPDGRVRHSGGPFPIALPLPTLWRHQRRRTPPQVAPLPRSRLSRARPPPRRRRAPPARPPRSRRAHPAALSRARGHLPGASTAAARKFRALLRKDSSNYHNAAEAGGHLHRKDSHG